MSQSQGLTVENYCKWYCLYLVSNSGAVSRVEFSELPDVEGETTVGDHVVNPRAVMFYAEARGLDLDDCSLEIIIGRWHLEHLNSYDFWC